ncbi:hypothetical protein V2H77_11585 [Photorhabdus sp. P32]|uniref:hypothetical protein n=1 Tax=Photorhabdus sp. P32 TaxID=3117549 RepID=UPI00311AC655
MLSNLERWVLTFDFCFKPTHIEAPDILITDILARVDNLVQQGRAVKTYNKGTRVIRISKSRYVSGDTNATFLVQLCDQNASDPVFANLATGTLRVEPKLDGEGIAVSSHVVISTTPSANTVDHFKTLVESVPGISKSVIEPFMNAVLKDAFEGSEFVNPATRAKCKLRPRLEIFSHGSQTIIDALQGGKIHNVRLVSTKRKGGLDKTAYTELIERVVKFKVVKQPSTKDRSRLLDIFRRKGFKEDYNKVSISYSKDGKQSSLELDRNEDAATKLFTKSEKVILPDGINQCEENIHKDLEQKMKGLL